MTNHDPIVKNPPTSPGTGSSGSATAVGVEPRDIESQAAIPELHIPDFVTELEIGTDSSDVSPHEIGCEWAFANFPKQESRDDDSALGVSVL